VVTSPHTLHYPHAKLALERGKHVMCEKPFCTKAEHARELVRLARQRGLHLLVPYGWHYKPFVRQAKQWLDEGLLGKLQFAMCHMASPIRTLLQGGDSRWRATAGKQAACCLSRTRRRGLTRLSPAAATARRNCRTRRGCSAG
jgi:predicted dehydrogenase